jgi:hypothetical protein
MIGWLNLFACGCDVRFIPQKGRLSTTECCMSALAPKADIDSACRNVCFVPKADITYHSELLIYVALPC